MLLTRFPSPRRASYRVVRQEKQDVDVCAIVIDDDSDEESKRLLRRSKRHVHVGLDPGAHVRDGVRFKGLKMVYGGMDVPGSIYDTLEYDTLLDDTVIDFFFKWLPQDIPSDMRDSFFFCSSFFFKKLVEGEVFNYCNVERWTKEVDIFKKRFVLVPIHMDGHWSLVVICNPGRMKLSEKQPEVLLLHFDSMATYHKTGPVLDSLCAYLQLEWQRHLDAGPEDSRAKEWSRENPGKQAVFKTYGEADDEVAQVFLQRVPGLPKQEDPVECGPFMLMYAHFFCGTLGFTEVRSEDLVVPTCSYVNAMRMRAFIGYRVMEAMIKALGSPAPGLVVEDPRIVGLRERVAEYTCMPSLMYRGPRTYYS